MQVLETSTVIDSHTVTLYSRRGQSASYKAGRYIISIISTNNQGVVCPSIAYCLYFVDREVPIMEMGTILSHDRVVATGSRGQAMTIHK